MCHPRHLYGLDSVRLTKKDVAALDTFYKQLLKEIQRLLDTKADDAAYLLLGTVLVEAIIHMKVFGLFVATSRLGKHQPSG